MLEPSLIAHTADAQVLNLPAACCLSIDRPHDAETYWRRAITLKPDYCDAHSNLGVALKELGRLDEAAACYHNALAITPNHAGAYVNMGRLYAQLGRTDEAESAYLRALELQPNDGDFLVNLGVLYQAQMRLPEAEAAYRSATVANPRDVKAHFNLGVVLKMQQRFAEAEASYRQTLALQPDYFEVKINLAHLLLNVGRLEEGWALFETRYDSAWPDRKIGPPPVGFPIWRGESLAGKSLLVWLEQGHGDSLQFCRYLPMLKALGLAKLSVACSPALQSLFETIEGVDRCIVLDGEHDIPQHDYVCLTMSLPQRLGTTTLDAIPRTTPYLRVPPAYSAKWKGRLPEGNLKVGLVWAGDPRPDQPEINAVDRRRSLDARAYLPLLRVPGITFVSLQKGRVDAAANRHAPAGFASIRSDARRSRVCGHSRDHRTTRPCDYRRYIDRASGGRVEQADVDSLALRRLLALAARSRRYAVVSARTSVPSDAAWRVGRGDRARENCARRMVDERTLAGLKIFKNQA